MIGELIVVTINNLMSYLVLILILQYLCCAHLKLSNKNLIICTLTALFFIISTQFFCSELFGFYLIFILYYATIFILSYKRIKDILLSFVAFVLYTALGVIPPMMLSYLPISYNDSITLFGIQLSVTSVGLDIIMLILLLVLRRILNKYQLILKFNAKEIIFSVLMFCFSYMTLVFMKLINDSDMSWWTDLFWKLFLMAAFISSIIYYVYILTESRIRLYHENLTRTQITYLTTQLDALQYLKEKEADTQKLRHDLKKHLSVIQALCAEERFDEVRTYSNELNGTFPAISNPISGNKIADTILATSMKKANNNGITFTFEGSLSKLDALSAPDICSLLGNAYDNAIEACQKQTDAFIHTKAHTTAYFISIEICNSIPKKLRIRGNRIITTKRDKKNHGYGIAIMEQIAQKYHGQCTLLSSDSKFTLRITLRP